MNSLLELALTPLKAHPTLKAGDRIAVAMSGGVDSSVAAALLHHAGYEVVGVSLQLFDKTGQGSAEGRCCTLDDFQDARRVAFELGFPHYVVDHEAAFRDTVIEPFIESYLAGETPSPCIRCNQHLKFGALLDRAEAMGAAFVATGHYARIGFEDGAWRMLKAADPAKDQSYYLFHQTQATMARTLFPLGHLRKPEVRELGRELGLHLSEKAESQEICFVGAQRYDAFIEASGRAPRDADGEIRHEDGRILGRHEGAWRYTVGQRKGLGIAHAAPLYVSRLDHAARTVWVAEDEALDGLALHAKELSWCGQVPAEPLTCSARIRARGADGPCLVTPLSEGRAEVRFETAQRAIAPGQAVVFYEGDAVLGGGWITR
ncbi:MAG TPA: tRNA 2-thiouridine(34) synthase MnmA [Holophagaceae bacterium]|jgi:tRNA-specific 2-thiouridylase|nr:tRNA 2-thiouridine(34) synthase MnmA [Holophagaceae bacterium]